MILAGTGIGGGSRINWGASFRTPPHVRREWAARHGAAFVDTPKFTRALDTICGRLGVHTNPEYQRDRSATALKAGALVRPPFRRCSVAPLPLSCKPIFKWLSFPSLFCMLRAVLCLSILGPDPTGITTYT